jgi:ketosteroid isomerase-like protein
MAINTSSSSHTDIEQELLELERQFWQALKDNDVEAALKLTDDPCFLTGAQGTMAIDHQAFRNMMKNPGYTIHRFEIVGEPLVRALSDDVAIVAYQVREELTVEGKPVTLEAADSSVWLKKGGRWRCCLHTESPRGDSFGRNQ